MTDRAWKANERMIAKYIGCQRIPVSGRQRGDNPDLDHPHLACEVKLRKTIPAWLKDAMDQAQASKRRKNDMPVVIIRERGQRVEDALIVTTLGEFRERYL